jgi:hypothetical protein
MDKKIVRILLRHYTKIGHNGGIAKVIFDDEFEDIAEEIVKSFAIPIVSVCTCPMESTDVYDDEQNYLGYICKGCGYFGKY